MKDCTLNKRSRTAFGILIAVFVLGLLPGCATKPSAAASSPLAIVEQYLAALNRRDLLALTAYVTPDVAWYSIVNGERITEVSGRELLAKTLASYYAQTERTHWKIEQAIVVGATVSVQERSEWRAADGNGERVTLVVYEITDGRIARINYFLGTP